LAYEEYKPFEDHKFSDKPNYCIAMHMSLMLNRNCNLRDQGNGVKVIESNRT